MVRCRSSSVSCRCQPHVTAHGVTRAAKDAFRPERSLEGQGSAKRALGVSDAACHVRLQGQLPQQRGIPGTKRRVRQQRKGRPSYLRPMSNPADHGRIKQVGKKTKHTLRFLGFARSQLEASPPGLEVALVGRRRSHLGRLVRRARLVDGGRGRHDEGNPRRARRGGDSVALLSIVSGRRGPHDARGKEGR